MQYTHFQAVVKLPGHYFPLYGEITGDSLIMLANNGTSTAEPTGRVRQEAERIKTALIAGRTVSTKAATISPLTAEEYERAR